MSDIFLSYAREDEATARALAKILNDEGFSVWWDRSLSVGEKFDTKIEINLAHAVVTLWSSASIASEWVIDEASLALEQNKLFPVSLAQLKPPLKFRRLHSTDLKNWDESTKTLALNSLIGDIKRRIQRLGSGVAFAPDTPISTPRVSDQLTIIVPAFNESKGIRGLIGRLRTSGISDRFNIILCDDGSSDETYRLMLEWTNGLQNFRVTSRDYNTRKVGAIDTMTQLTETPFVFTLDADCSIEEMEFGALEKLCRKMELEKLDAIYFRIVPEYTDWLGKLQALDYAIFTDTLRKILSIPICLIGQGILWRTSTLKDIISVHSKEFDGDDLENTIIALEQSRDTHWDKHSVIISTIPKRTISSLFRQRALSWDYGLLRVLTTRRAIRLSGESGAFYKCLLLMDVIAHPFRLAAIPLLITIAIRKIFGYNFEGGAFRELYWQSFSFTFQYGATAILLIWLLCVASSALCVKRVLPTLKWTLFSGVYLSSPFAYFMYYPLFADAEIDNHSFLVVADDWVGFGLLITYAWWVLITLFLLIASTLNRKEKISLIGTVPFAPIYFLGLLVAAKTVGIAKFCSTLLFRK